jgi:hypothetical protein
MRAVAVDLSVAIARTPGRAHPLSFAREDGAGAACSAGDCSCTAVVPSVEFAANRDAWVCGMGLVSWHTFCRVWLSGVLWGAGCCRPAGEERRMTTMIVALRLRHRAGSHPVERRGHRGRRHFRARPGWGRHGHALRQAWPHSRDHVKAISNVFIVHNQGQRLPDSGFPTKMVWRTATGTVVKTAQLIA